MLAAPWRWMEAMDANLRAVSCDHAQTVCAVVLGTAHGSQACRGAGKLCCPAGNHVQASHV